MIKLFFDKNSKRIFFRQTPNANTRNDKMYVSVEQVGHIFLRFQLKEREA